MKGSLILAAALAASVNGAVIEARQRPRPTSRAPVDGTPDGIASPALKRNSQTRLPQFSISRPTQSVILFPSDPSDWLSDCGLDSFVGHTAEALLFCSSILKGGTATQTVTSTSRETLTTKTTVYTTLYPTSIVPSSTRRASTSTVRPPPSSSSVLPPPPPSSTRVTPPSPSSSSVIPPPPSSTRVPPPPTSSSSKVAPPPSSTPKPSSSTPKPSSSLVIPSSTIPAPPSSTLASPTTTPTAPGCGLVGYTKTVAAYYFDSSGTKNTWTACNAACKADTKCLSFGYGEANCLLFDVTATDNTNYNPMSPYTFYDASCPKELPVKKRQVNISLNLPGGPPAISSACSCLITSGTPDKITTTTVFTSQKTTTTQTVTRTVSLLPEDMRR